MTIQVPGEPEPRVFGLFAGDRISRRIEFELPSRLGCDQSLSRPRMQWYYSKNGTQLGPVEEDVLRAKLASGEVSTTDLVWRDGMSDWMAAARVAEFSSLTTVSAAIPSVPPPVSGGGVNSPYAPPASGQLPAGYAPNIPNYLWQSIVVTILCCWPFGIPAIVYAAKVDGLKARGDIAGAMAASNNAKTWCLVAGGLGLVFGLLVLIMAFLAPATAN